MRVAFVLAVATILTGCADAPAPAVSAQNGRTWEHRCPPAGLVVRTSNGLTMTYAGEAGPGLCRRRDGRTALYSMWLVPAGQQSEDVRQWLGDLFPARAGRTSHRGAVDAAVRTRNTFLFTNDAKVLGFETLNLPAGQLDTVVIEWEHAGTSGNIHRTRHRRWLDTSTGALVKSEARVLGGVGQEHAWHALSVTVPPGGTP